MGMSLQAGASGPSGARRRRGRKHKPMAEINVTPFVDVMLVLLIIFMVAAPLLTAGVPVDLPKSEGAALQSDSEPLTLTVDPQGRIFIQETEIPFDGLQAKLQAITEARKDMDEAIYVRGDKTTNYGELMRVMGRIAAAGYKKLSLVTELDDKR
ncbi:protein TolR [Rhodomicrobium vannielii ATCC 17100]|uniref:protein TolR n=1 Tax=Rhodomicrobium vannielii TaxID=1069 RepID=UPI00191952CA|nr:protein TolR [Rhodomicrobium vannielii]MBJ7533149.1 protein TolR [Rhodomicrobium vannielii ATCC 17100]